MNRIATALSLMTTFAFCAEIPLHIDVPTGIAQGRWPVTLGIPFPKDTLKKGTSVVVTADGKTKPTQTVPLATWGKDSSDVRWLLVDFHVDAASAGETDYRLVFGKDVPRPPEAPRLSRTRNGDLLEIDTGVARFVLQDRGGLSFRSVTVGDHAVVKESPIRFIVTDHEGKTYTASGDSNPEGAVIEDDGMCRLGLKSEGWYRDANNGKFCRHETRLEFFAESSLVRVLHTWIFTGTSDSHQVRDLAIELPLNAEETSTSTFGLSAIDPNEIYSSQDVRHLSFVQDCKNRFELTSQLKNQTTGDTLADGDKYAGWCDLSDSRGGVTAAFREAWQNYPNELEIQDNTLRLHLWPKHGRLLDFRTDALLWPYGEEGIKTIDRFFKSQRPPYTKSLYDIYNNAMGVAKTHEVWLDFHKGPVDKTRAIAVSTQANTPVLGTADPKWNAASGAIGPMHHADSKQFPETEAMLDAMFDRYVYWRDHHMDYGWFDYQDVHCDARGDKYGHPVAGGRIAKLWRHWDSTHYGFPNAPWILYYRSGKRKYLQFAEANSRHCMDIDRCHFGDEKERYKGGHYYCDWSVIHWNRYTADHINYDKLEYLLYSYYMRGYRRSLSVMKDWAELSLRYYLAGNENRPLRMILPPRLKNIRHYGPPLGNLTELYRVTWDERYLEAARKWAWALVDMHPKNDDDWKNFGAVHFCWESMANYVRLTDDPDLKRVLASYADRSIQDVLRYGSVGDAAYGYQTTGDARFLDAGKARLLQLVSDTNTGSSPAQRGSSGRWVSGHHPYSMRTIPALLAGMVSNEKWSQTQVPLIETNESVQMAGPRLPTIYLNAADKGTAKVRLWLGQQQAFEFRNSKNEVASQVERAFPPISSEVEWNVANNEASGTHTIKFPLRPTRHAGDYIERGNVNFISAENSRVAFGPSTKEGHFCVFGPRFYFHVPKGTTEFTLESDAHATWAAYAWHPVIDLFDADGKIVATHEGDGKHSTTFRPDEEQTGRLWSLGPVGRVSAPMDNRTWRNPVRPFDEHFPLWFKFSKNIPQFVSPNSKLFFIPAQQTVP